MDFVYTNVAKDDIRDILMNLKTIEKSFAEKFLRELDLKKSMLVMFPLAGVKIATPSLQLEYRFVQVAGYMLIYTVNPSLERIEVSRVLPEKMNWRFMIR